MDRYTSDFFGLIQLNSIEDDYDAEFNYNGRIIELDLNIYKEQIPNIEQLKQIDKFLNELEKYEIEIREFISNDFKKNGISREYIEFYTDSFEDYELEKVIDKNHPNETAEEQLIKTVYIQRIGFYPNDNFYAIFDFHVNHEISDQILVIVLENDRSYDITWES